MACLGGGPSLNPKDVDRLKGRTRVIAINDAFKLCPWADVLYACDMRWWAHHEKDALGFAGVKVTLDEAAANRWPTLKWLRNTGQAGLETDPTGLRTGRNGGYQAINLAFHFGASRILLLGYDMRLVDGKRHWFGDHPLGLNAAANYDKIMLPHFPSLATALDGAGVEVINCTPGSALTMWPIKRLDEVL